MSARLASPVWLDWFRCDRAVTLGSWLDSKLVEGLTVLDAIECDESNAAGVAEARRAIENELTRREVHP